MRQSRLQNNYFFHTKEPKYLIFMHKIGITGGIGSGKSTACRLFELLNIPIYYADQRAKWLMAHDPALKMAIQDLLGEASYSKEGQLNRAYIAQEVFQNHSKLEALNGIVHPAVGLDRERWQMEQEGNGAPYSLSEIAILFESGLQEQFDRVITVYAPLELRIQRVMKRDGAEREGVLARIRKQMPDEQKLKLADYILYNDGEQPLIPQVWQLHQQLLQL